MHKLVLQVVTNAKPANLQLTLNNYMPAPWDSNKTIGTLSATDADSDTLSYALQWGSGDLYSAQFTVSALDAVSPAAWELHAQQR